MSVENRLLIISILLGGSVSALTDALPFLNFINCLCCVGVALGGVVSVLYFRAHLLDDDKVLSMPIVVQLGIGSGIAGALLAMVFHYVIFDLYGNWQIEWITNMIENLDEIPPMWEELYEELQSEEYQGFDGFAILIRSLIIFPVFSFLGAMITNRIQARKQGMSEYPKNSSQNS